MDTIETMIEQAEKRCRANGKRLTSKRKQVLTALLHADKALSVYELIDYAKTHFGQTVQAMSAYRILEFLEEEHLAHKLNASSKYVACAHIHHEHEHGVPQFLICRQCNKTQEQTLDPSLITNLESDAKQVGFKVLTPQLEIDCLCHECSQSSD